MPKSQGEDKGGSKGSSLPHCPGGDVPLVPSPSSTFSHTYLQLPAGIYHQQSPFQLIACPQQMLVSILNVPPAPHLSRAAASLPSPPGTHTGCWGQPVCHCLAGHPLSPHTRHRSAGRDISAPKVSFRRNAGDSLAQGWMGRLQ